jgi:hypothetical protein
MQEKNTSGSLQVKADYFDFGVFEVGIAIMGNVNRIKSIFIMGKSNLIVEELEWKCSMRWFDEEMEVRCSSKGGKS